MDLEGLFDGLHEDLRESCLLQEILERRRREARLVREEVHVGCLDLPPEAVEDVARRDRAGGRHVSTSSRSMPVATMCFITHWRSGTRISAKPSAFSTCRNPSRTRAASCL